MDNPGTSTEYGDGRIEETRDYRLLDAGCSPRRSSCSTEQVHAASRHRKAQKGTEETSQTDALHSPANPAAVGGHNRTRPAFIVHTALFQCGQATKRPPNMPAIPLPLNQHKVTVRDKLGQAQPLLAPDWAARAI
jgi:hypothetical protein